MAAKEKMPGTEIAKPDKRYQLASLPEDASWDQLVSYGRAVEHGSKWVLGDLAVRVASDKAYGEGKIKALADGIGISHSTLRNYMQVSAAFPPGEKSHRGIRPWSVYRELAGSKARFQHVARHETLTVGQAQALVPGRRAGNKPTRKAASKPTAAKPAHHSAPTYTTHGEHQPEPREVTDEDRAQAVTYGRQAVRLEEMAAEIRGFDLAGFGEGSQAAAAQIMDSMVSDLRDMAVTPLVPLSLDDCGMLEDDDPLMTAAREELAKLMESEGLSGPEQS